MHLGGGTPTFFSPDNLKRLIQGILNKSALVDNHEFSFEGHPNNTTKAHLQTFFDLGFRRVSFGVQENRTPRPQWPCTELHPSQKRGPSPPRVVWRLGTGHRSRHIRVLRS